MKTLAINCWLGLIVCFIAAPAYPASYQIDVGGDGSFETGSIVDLCGQSNVPIDFYFDNYTCPPHDMFFGLQTYITLNENLVRVNSFSPGSWCDLTLSGCSQQEPNVYLLICSYFSL